VETRLLTSLALNRRATCSSIRENGSPGTSFHKSNCTRKQLRVDGRGLVDEPSQRRDHADRRQGDVLHLRVLFE
jgi:hypothetical protein